MISFLGCSDQAIAVANGVTTVALLEHLVERKILTCAEVRTILESGIKCLAQDGIAERHEKPFQAPAASMPGERSRRRAT